MKNLKINKFLYWIPRIMGILFILFISMFALDIFDMNLGFWGTVVGLFMHLIPSFILIIVLVICWKYEMVGAIIFSLAGLAYIIMDIYRSLEFGPNYISWLLIAGPAVIIGILFGLNWWMKRNID